MPLVLCTTLLRLGHFIKLTDSGGKSEEGVRGMVSNWDCQRLLSGEEIEREWMSIFSIPNSLLFIFLRGDRS